MTALAPFRSRPAHVPVPSTVRREDVGDAAWFGLLRDGVLRPLWQDVAVRADLAETPELRARGLSTLVPTRAVVGRASAAWVHVGGPLPARVDLLFAPGTRRTDPHPLRTAAEAHLSPGDAQPIGPVRVTSVQRTGLDVARSEPPARAAPLLAALRGVGFDPLLALDELARLGPARGVRRARTVLTDCARAAPG